MSTESEKKHHNADGTFNNPWPSAVQHDKFADFYRVLKDLKPVDLPPKVKEFPVTPLDWERLAAPPADKIQLTWIGHASFLLQMEGLNILTDPIFSDRCSAVQFVGPKRFTPPPFAFNDAAVAKFPKIDLVIISHNHYDHLDTNTVKALLPKVNMWYVPLGIGKWMMKCGAKPAHVVELDWWQQRIYGVDRLAVVCTPCQHFSGRFIHDRNTTLWSSWALLGKQSRFYFAGDTGYRSVPKGKTEEEIAQMQLPICPAFKEIGDKYGPFDLACIPIGAYSPRWFMSAIHCNPEDSVNVHIDIKSKQSVGMHWGTFKLTDEPIWEPPVALSKYLAAKKLTNEEFTTMQHGEIKQFTPGSGGTAEQKQDTPTVNLTAAAKAGADQSESSQQNHMADVVDQAMKQANTASSGEGEVKLDAAAENELSPQIC